MEAKKAIILARVSTKDQEEGHSIDAQVHRLKEYCQRKGLHVIQTYEIVESSTRGDRKRFMDMVAAARRHKECVAIVADKVDRVQRSFREFPLLDDLIQRGSIELHFYSDNVIIHKESRSSDRTMWSMRVLLAQSYTDATSENIRRSLEHKRRIGEWAGPAPIGYLNTRDEFGKSIIVADPVRAPIIIRLFEEYATGAFTLSEMTAKAKQWGLRSKKGCYLQKSVIHRLFQHGFYCGDMEIKGEIYAHRHETLVPRWLFKACQEVRLGHHKKPFKYAEKEFVFRGLLTCATTGRVVTGDTKTRKYVNGNTAQWTYLRCWNPDQPEKIMWVREEEIIKQVEDIISRLGIREKEFLDTTIEYMKEMNRLKKEHHTIEVAQLKKEHTEIQAKLDRLMDLRLNDELTKEEFESNKRRLKDRQYELTDLINTYDKADDEFTKRMEWLLTLTHKAPELWAGSTISQKRELLNFLFANLKLKGATLCYELRKPFDDFLDGTDCPKWRTGRDSNPR
jgi:site-specific DNA recombinase